MDAQKAVNELCDHFLGKDWYITDSVNEDRANDIIVEEIKSKYQAVDEDPVDRYRRRHKKCRWCKHCSIIYRCKVKNKIVNPEIPRPFCSVFELKRGDL